MYLIDEKRDVNQASSVLKAFQMKRSRGENKKNSLCYENSICKWRV